MTTKNDAKFEEELTCCFKTCMRNFLLNDLHNWQTTQKSKKTKKNVTQNMMYKSEQHNC